MVGFVARCLPVLDLFARRFELRFLLVQLLCVAPNENLFFGAAAQGFHVFAQPPLVFHDTVDVFLPVFHFFFEFGDHGPLHGDFFERLGHFPRALPYE